MLRLTENRIAITMKYTVRGADLDLRVAMVHSGIVSLLNS